MKRLTYAILAIAFAAIPATQVTASPLRAAPTGLTAVKGNTPAGTYTGAVRKLLVDVADRAIAGAPEYRVYYHDGACHSERDADGNNAEVGSVPSCDYDQMVQDGVKFSDWVRGWMRVPGYSWNDVR